MKVTLNKAYRQAAAKAGIALPNGKFPIPDKAHLRAAIAYRHSSSVPVKQVEAHIRKRAAALHVKLPATFALEEFWNHYHSPKTGQFASGNSRYKSGPGKGLFSIARTSKRGPKHSVWGYKPHARQSFTAEFAQGPGKKFGRSNSLKWPWLYDKLRAKGYDKSKAAAISNSRLVTRKHGRLNVLKAEQAHDPKVLKKLAVADKAGKHSTRKQLTSSAEYFACHDKSCAPPPAGVGGSKPGGASTFQD